MAALARMTNGAAMQSLLPKAATERYKLARLHCLARAQAHRLRKVPEIMANLVTMRVYGELVVHWLPLAACCRRMYEREGMLPASDGRVALHGLRLRYTTNQSLC